MLSILIPIYNFDSSRLIKTLHEQCRRLNFEFEILCIDDASQETCKNNSDVCSNLAHCSYERLQINQGRAKIRHTLALKAQFDLLLFLDCDNAIVNPKFIEYYLNHKTAQVTYGGRTYKPTHKPEHLLHYTYGKKRESISAQQRNLKPHRSFCSTNFLIQKSLFLKLPKIKNFKGYGYEDLAMGQFFKSNLIQIKHIDNAAIHLGLESKDVFLSKSINALENLKNLYHNKQIEQQQVKILNVYLKLKALQLHHFLSFKVLDKLKNQLKSKSPSLFLFDLWRLHHLHKIFNVPNT